MKAVIIYCIILGVLAVNNLCAQSSYINTYQYNNYNTVFKGVIIESDTLIVSGLSFSCFDSTNCYQGFYISKFDTLGQVLKDTVILAPDDDIVAGNTSILCKTPDNGYMMVGGLYRKNSIFIVKLNHNFDLQFENEIQENSGETLSAIYRGIVFLKGHYYILAMKQYLNNQRIAHIIKIDSLGNLVWDKPYYKEGNASMTFKESRDGNLMVYGQTAKINDEKKADIKQWCFFADTSGSIVKEHESDWMTNKLSGYFYIHELDQGYLISTSNYYYDPEIFPYPKDQIVLQKVNEDFNLLWSTTYGDATIVNSIRNILPSGDGNYIGTGNYSPYPDNQENSALTTLTIKFNESGHILWDRLDSILYEPVFGSRNTTAESVILNSGSIITSGYTDIHLPIQGSLGFVMKLDKNGCVMPNCNLSVSTTESNLLLKSVNVYPNPTSEYVNINLIDTYPAAIIRIYDVNGLFLYEQQVFSGLNSIQLVGDLHFPGLFIWRVFASNGKPIDSGTYLVFN